MATRESIKSSFEAAASTYADHSGFQRMVAGEIAIRARVSVDHNAAARENMAGERLAAVGVRLRVIGQEDAPAEPGLIVDIGCGTGWLASALAGAFPVSRLVGVDIAPAMAARAAESAPGNGAAFVASDCEALPFAEATFDVAASNLTYQWTTDLARAFSEAHRVLAPGGLFIFSTLGPATFTELAESLGDAGHPHPPAASAFADAHEVEATLGGAGFIGVDINRRCERVAYRDTLTLLRTLRNIGAAPAAANALGNGGLGRGSLLRKAGRIYAERFPSPGGQGVAATYELIVGIARKDYGDNSQDKG